MIPNDGYNPLPFWAPSYPEPASIFSGNLSIGLLCRAPEGVLEQLVPAPLQLVGDDLYQVNWLLTRQVRGEFEPDVPFLENMLVVEFGAPVEYNGEAGGHCFLEYTDSDEPAMIGRELYGWPKKMGQFVWDETPEGYHLELRRKGVTLLECDVTLDDPSIEPGQGWPDVFGVRDDAPYLQVRNRFGVGDQPSYRDVLRVPVEETSSEPGRAAKATLTLRDGVRDPLSILGPVEVLGARVDRNDFIFPYGEVVDSVEISKPAVPATLFTPTRF